MADAVRLHGWSALQRDLGKINRGLERSVRNGMREAAEPVVGAARSKEAKWQGSKPNTIGTRATRRSVFVTQRARKVTGKRPDYGALQMKDAFLPALEENAFAIHRAVEKALDRLLTSAHL